MIANITTQIRYDAEQQHSETALELSRPMERAALNDAQQLLVRDNIGLVRVHMKHYVDRHGVPWTKREWEDLFQDGCLGLIRAAQDFNPLGKIPFAAFALPRIHSAVRRAMLKRHGNGVAGAGGDASAKRSLFGVSEKPDWSPRKPRRSTHDESPLDALGDWKGANKDTVGVRLREKYERAVHRAVACVLAQGDADDTQAEIVRALATDRHLVPDAHARRPYRQIARRTNAPYTRVIQYDRQLREAIRRGLEGDPEFSELLRMTRAEPRGVESPVDDQFEKHLARLSAAELLQRLLNTCGERREHMVGRLFELAAPSLHEAIRKELEQLPIDAREQLLSES